MSSDFLVRRLDVAAFARAGQAIDGRHPLTQFERLASETAQGASVEVQWRAQGEVRRDAADQPHVWLHLFAQVVIPLICQRCMESVDVTLDIAREFRFVASEEQAEAEDDESEEDVLVLSRELDLLDLVEDELLMAMPLVPRHEVCPTQPRLAVQDRAFDDAIAEKPHPFAALANLKGRAKS